DTRHRQQRERQRAHERPEPPPAVGRVQRLWRRGRPHRHDNPRLVQPGAEDDAEVDDKEPEQKIGERHRPQCYIASMSVVMVTGGSRGIGAETAKLAAARGYSVCVNYRANRGAADAVVADIVSHGGRAIAVQADVASEPEVVRLFET